MTDINGALIPAAQVRERFGGVSDMWLYRRLNDDSGFPRPLYIGRLRFWRVSELAAWEEKLPRTSSARPPSVLCRGAVHDESTA